MPKDKAKSRRRQRHNSNDGEENISRKERDWLQAHLPEQKKSSWRTVYFPHEGKYIGHVNARGQRHGEGFLLGEKGMCYEGTWEDGLMSGVGVKQFPSGDRYEGNHIAGQRSGWGYYLFQCGDKYTGQWVANVMEGQGCFVWAGGDMYSGSWKKGVISGRGHKTYADGSNVKGIFPLNSYFFIDSIFPIDNNADCVDTSQHMYYCEYMLYCDVANRYVSVVYEMVLHIVFKNM